MKATAKSYSNIAFIKYWGNRDDTLRLPANGSISMNLEGLETVTTVAFDEMLEQDELVLNSKRADAQATERVSKHLDYVRAMVDTKARAHVESSNNFPMGAGIASSASAFSALTVAACGALGVTVSEAEMSRLARLGSGSASRSIPTGFVEWYVGDSDEASFAESIAPPDHWDLVDLVAVVSKEHKAVGSTGGHAIAPTSPLQQARIDDTARRLDLCRSAILERNFEQFVEVVEQDTLIMHGVMMTSTPSLMYWSPGTIRVMEEIRALRSDGVDVCFTIDAGANVHMMTYGSHVKAVREAVSALESVQSILEGRPGGAAHLV